jgi:inhibitor of the pro-sigma K processing machinery
MMYDWADWNLIAAIIFGLFVIYFLSRIFYKPLKLFFQAILHIVLGAVMILLFNLVGALWGLTVGLNLASALVVGIMGLPGLGMLVALRLILI